MRFLSNEWSYLAYFWMLLLAALILFISPWVLGYINRLRPKKGVFATLTVDRGQPSMGIIHGAFVVIAGINIGISQAVIPTTERIKDYSFIMLLLETAAWAYIIYRSSWFRNKLLAAVQKAAKEK